MANIGNIFSKLSTIGNKWLLLETFGEAAGKMVNSSHFGLGKKWVLLESFRQKLSNSGKKWLPLETWKLTVPGK